MADPTPDQDLVERCRNGDEEAARILFDRFVERLLVLARRRISQRLASRVDPEDIVQSVFRTFFERLKNDQFVIDDQDDLMKLLVRITVHKTLRQVAFHKAAKRDPSLETAQTDHTQEQLAQVLDEEPSPETIVAFMDQLEFFFAQLKPLDRQILELKMQGHSSEEIAEKLGTYDRKVRRVLERIRTVALTDSGHLPS
ncbi:RNA polymerase sigma factor [Tuwongella immobilis]|uniref:RNA polymerase sigma-70 ECF-like HTH domain-containing protein n=1 Tax=Tuwongella immobilis TaxID=692036 RepID=A0A6C2YWY3_9BACT|nr:sigma-70 family RNA polymerase sigma factor [Tuwongella immobilis]VIP05653.1 rna polymerase sigma-70 ecf-like protein : Transcription regulator LuxR OS=Rhodopirellula sallentina SM41 GN=RSSM_00164 PE=4 SV=1: Sigma70_ECF [Tuwongella immobilis]VTS08662.1 rna polymerase sigma-70 ecf-like protein : Transcription regulator LuxR OS=Rhodopirellula sallentina SM41 GN=RSSM_00164 PE=4 SV=1: Sigma70_ECF [Tuwongella immobilis]